MECRGERFIRDGSIGAAAVCEKALLRQSDVEQCKNQAHSLSGYRVTLI